LAPAIFDLGRAATGLLLTHGAALTDDFLAAYAAALTAGKPYHLEAELAHGPVKLLFERVESRTRKEFLKIWTKDGKIREVPDATYRLPAATRKRVQRIFEGWASQREDPKYYRVLDVCGSTAGVGSLCVERYLVLVRGDKKPHILDMKEATPSTLASTLRIRQPKWKNEAHRAADVQRMLQYMPIAHLRWTDTSPTSFHLTEFQPAEDRMESLDLTEKEFAAFACDWGRLVAWSHLRGSGWNGSPPADELIAFGKRLTAKPMKRILTLAAKTAREISKAHRRYAATVVPEE
jgi:uncharacterized protein (DUF2252 family)